MDGGAPYREAPDAAPRDPNAPAPPLAVIEVSGPDGAHARDGRAGQSASGYGDYGQAGEGASPAAIGEPAGTIRVALAEADGVVTVRGEAIADSGKRAEVREQLVAIESGYVELRAHGGRGGNGGAGGRGGEGAGGRPGSDATRYSSGGDGGRGGDGGEGGAGTDGARGGDGGAIVIEVADADTPLLMLVRPDVVGGLGGKAGKHGYGGNAGGGGAGGDSYSWTTSSSYTDKSGTHTRTHYHRNPGGNRGPSGINGRTPNRPIVAGANGADGALTIQVAMPDGKTVAYPSRYDLWLAGFEHDSMNADAVHEPDELVRVFSVDVTNVGGMPTPAQDDLQLSLLAGGWVRPEPGELLCPRSLAPDTPTRIAGELRFRIKDFVPTEPSDPLEVEENILHRAMLPSVGRAFENYQAPSMDAGKFVIRFPLRASKVTNLRALAVGETTRVKVSITNQSRFALGAQSDSKRVIRVRVAAAPDNELTDAHAVLEGTIAPSDGWTQEIPLLDAGETIEVALTVTIKEGAPEYARFSAHATLELGALAEPARARPIQLRGFDLRVARPFKPNEADVLLVVNHKTTREELAGWQRLAEQMAFRIGTWDLTREGHFDLEAPIGASGALLMEMMAGKSIAVLDNAIDGPDGPIYPHAFVSSDQAVRAAEAGIDIAFIGKGPDLRQLVVPAGATTLALAKPEQPTTQALVAAEPPRATVPVFRRYWLRFWAKPDEEFLAAQAQALARDLAGAYPTHRHVVVHRFAPVVESKFLWIKKWRVGALETVRTLDAAKGSLVHLKLDEQRLHDPAYFDTDEARTALVVLFDGTDTLERLQRLASSPDVPQARLDLVVDVLLLDIANELAAVCAPGGGANGDEISEAMPTLKAVAASALTASYDSVTGGALLRFAGRLVFFARAQVRTWEKLPPWRWVRRTMVAREIVEERVQAMLATAFPNVDAATITADVERIAGDLLTEHRLLFKAGRAEPLHLWSLAQLRAPIASASLTLDTEVMATPEERVLTAIEYDAISTAAATAATTREQLVASAAEARRALGS